MVSSYKKMPVRVLSVRSETLTMVGDNCDRRLGVDLLCLQGDQQLADSSVGLR